MRVWLSRVWGFFHRRAVDRRLEEELRFHLEMEAEKNRGLGMSVEDAARAARSAFGGAQQVKEIYRERSGLPMLETLLKDLSYGVRTMRRNPGFTAVAVLSLALGIGANTAIFSLIHAVMLRSLPVESPQRLVSVGDANRPNGLSTGGPMVTVFSNPMYQRLRDENQVFSGLAASGRTGQIDANIDGGAAERIRGRLVSGNYFDVLGVPAFLGRTFTAAEDLAPGASPIVVISYDYWSNRLARDPRIIGRTLRLNDATYTVVGVGPRGFTGEVVGNAADVWIPLCMQAQLNPGAGRLNNRDANWLLLLGRLKPGVSLAQARANMTILARQALIDYAGAKLSAGRRREIEQETVEVEPCAKGLSSMRRTFEQPLVTLMIVVGLVLLIACTNVANLLLARAAGRQKEISVRLAVGASQARLVRQLLTECTLLSLMGGVAGSFLAWWGAAILLRVASSGPDPIPLDVHPNLAVLGFTAAVSLLTGILFGLVPALRSTRVDLAPALKESSRSMSNGGFRLGKLLVVGQVALSLLLLVGAGLFVRSLVNLKTLDVGYSRTRLVLLQLNPAASGYPPDQQVPAMFGLVQRFQSVLGVLGATMSENGIFSGTDSSTNHLRVEGYSSARKEDLAAHYDQIGPHYFQVVGVPVLAGRDFNERDITGAPGAAILNSVMAQFYFGGRNPIGQSFANGNDRYTIVGVVKDMKERDLKGKAERRFFVPMMQSTDRFDSFNFELRTRDDALHMLPAIRREIANFDPNLKVQSLEPVGVLIDRSISEDRLIAQLSGFFGLLALLLAATGLYGVMAYATSRRVTEIGIRMALGADRGEVIRMVLRETLVLVVIGIAIGLPAALAGTRMVAAMLVNLSASDPPTFGAATIMMLLVAVLAGFAPAAQASRIDPIAALRQE